MENKPELFVKTFYIKDFTYKGKVYRFKQPLKVRIENFLCSDYKTIGGEMYIAETLGGYTTQEPFSKTPEKEIKGYLKTVWEDYLMKEDKDLSIEDREYKHKWIDLLKPPKK